MSAYIHFFVKIGENFAPINTFSRSNIIFQEFECYAPWEKITPVTIEKLNRVRESLNEQIKATEDQIKFAKDEIEFLKSTKLSAEELMEKYHDYLDIIEGFEEGKCEYISALHFINFLIDIYDEANGMEKYGENPMNLRANEYIYVGYECGSYVTIKDISI